jgi:hypothetical protein
VLCPPPRRRVLRDVVTTFHAATIESVGYQLAIECYEVGAADGYQVRSIPGGPSHLVSPIVLTGATWVEAMNWCRDRVTADIAAISAAMSP